MSDNKIAIYEKKTIRELELELSLFKRERKACPNLRRIQWLEDHIHFLEALLIEKRT